MKRDTDLVLGSERMGELLPRTILLALGLLWTISDGGNSVACRGEAQGVAL